MRQMRIVRDKILIVFALTAVVVVIGILVWSQLTAPSFGDEVTRSGITLNTETTEAASDTENIDIHGSDAVRVDEPTYDNSSRAIEENAAAAKPENFSQRDSSTRLAGVPETGDDTMTVILIAILMISAIGVVLLTARRNQNQEE